MGCLGSKKLAKCQILREMNTVKNLFQYLPFNHIKLMFFRKLVTNKPGFH